MRTVQLGTLSTFEIALVAAEVMQKGGLIVFPTETAYGLGGNALDPGVVRKVFDLKQRPLEKPIYMVVRDIGQAELYAEINGEARKLARQFWPGPLTIIVPKKEIVPDVLTGGLKTVGLRVPDHPLIAAISSRVDFPYTATSANLSGKETPYNVTTVLCQLKRRKIGLMIDAGRLPQVEPSTVLDLTTSPPQILRPGPITAEQLRPYIKI